MTALERTENFLAWLVATAAGLIVSVVGWLVRRILTNQAQIEELKQEIAARNAQRELEMQSIHDIKEDIREMRADVKTLFARRGE